MAIQEALYSKSIASDPSHLFHPWGRRVHGYEAESRGGEKLNRPTTRRAFLGTGALAALALAGCGGGGSVTVPAEPKRVVSVYPTTVSALYDYGFDPVGVDFVNPEGISPRFRSRWEKAEWFGNLGELDLAKIAALEPDVIIGADYEWNTNYYSLGRARSRRP